MNGRSCVLRPTEIDLSCRCDRISARGFKRSKRRNGGGPVDKNEGGTKFFIHSQFAQSMCSLVPLNVANDNTGAGAAIVCSACSLYL